MPHLRLNDLNDLFIVIGLPENPAAAGADMIFMSLIGDHMSDVYLKMLAGLGRHLTNAAAVEELQNAARDGKNALWSYLQNSNIELRKVVTAEDVMTPVHISLHPDSPLSDAFDCFHNTHLRFLPVVDEHGKLVGELSARKVVKSFIPDYVYMMDSVNFMNDFSVFNKIFESEHSQPVSQFMQSEPARAALDTPLFQLTLLLTKQDGGTVYIVDAENTLQGIFAIENVISKVLRG
jgi:CBS-domain-containing membrane protein